ncbi:MAG: GerMN domain-containing protein [Cyanobacteria bacterium P01_A01_bin.123]
MEDRNPSRRRIPLRLVAGLSAITLFAGGAAALITWRALSPKAPVADFPTIETPDDGTTDAPPKVDDSAQAPTAPSADPDKTDAPAAEATGQVFWLADSEGRLTLVSSAIAAPSTEAPEDQLKAAVDQLLDGPTESDTNFSTIPPETQLVSLSIEPDGIHVALSEPFKTGGGSASMTGRLGQIVYTATSLDPNAKVWITVAGEPLTILGGEGLEVPQPITRETFDQNFPL